MEKGGGGRDYVNDFYSSLCGNLVDWGCMNTHSFGDILCELEAT